MNQQGTQYLHVIAMVSDVYNSITWPGKFLATFVTPANWPKNAYLQAKISKI